MATDEIREEPVTHTETPEPSRSTGIMAIIFALLVALAVGEIYTLSKVSSLHDSVAASQAQTRSEMKDQLASKVADLEKSNAESLESLKTELDQTAQRMGSEGKDLRHARALVSKLQKQTADEADALKQEIAQKADAQQVSSLSEDVSATKTDLNSTKQAVEATKSDLGMARSEFGTLIARNHDDIEQLRKMGERDYFEFTLAKNKQQHVAGVGLMLKKTNVKRHRFNMNLLADDMVIEKKDRTINEPVFFATGNSKSFYELVVNQVKGDQITGYISTPKGAVQTAANLQQGGQ